MRSNDSNRRKKLIVYPELQKRIIRDVSVVPIFVLILGSMVLAVNLRLSITEITAEGELPEIMYVLIACMTGFVFLSCFVTLSLGKRISNRMAGPLYRLHTAMKQVQSGEKGVRVSFRKGDYITNTADIFNQMMEAVENSKAAPESEKTPQEVCTDDGLQKCGASTVD